MKHQTIFEKVATHLFTQGVQSSDPNDSNTCLYRGPNGTKCAIGVLIPNKAYDKKMEKKTVHGLLSFYSLPESIFNDENLNLMCDLQDIHDDNSGNEYWNDTTSMRKALEVVGKRYGLKTDFLQNLSFKDR